jgi:two-component system, NarL family, nitrate/nitrite sensor histidine kinase NarX
LIKPKIQLVGGCASSFVNEVISRHVQEPGNDSNESAVSRGGEAGVLLEGFLQTIIKALHASAGIVRVLSPGGHELRTVGGTGLPDEVCQAESVVDAGCGVCGKSGNTNVVESSDAEFCRSRYGADFFGETCKFVLAVPFGKNDKEGEPAGVITLFFAEEQNVTDEIKRTLESYAELIRLGLQSVWKNEDCHQLNLLAERQAIANEIHDSLAQTLYYAKIRASLLLDAMKTDNDLLAFKCAQDIDEALEGSQKTVRELVTHFRCQMDPKGLKYALQKLVRDFIARTSITLEYVNQVDEIDLPLEYELQVFLIIRESLVNIATHSGATIARLTVICSDGRYQFTVEDNGGGVGSSVPPEGHYGLEIMRERALRIGGTVEVESLEGQGTRVQLVFIAPLASPNVK